MVVTWVTMRMLRIEVLTVVVEAVEKIENLNF